ncbi:hypothetical protein [Nocardia wallacei]|uniref:Uncharacterized protein n=1 Tax=Nocardia wallacei TaxID=480035 RepID=A0A7G1KE57_9NOCA|nr:hypothetical protein [Nocardia wallacei]BCK52399.1 hypothetical protein NWFMUON74_01710 [Nocardia wallacei]
MSRPALTISQVEQWNPGVLGTDAGTFGSVIAKGGELLQSMLTTQDDLAESWKGAGADAAARRVVNENTAGSHILGKIDIIKSAYTAQQAALTDAKALVVNKRNLFRDVRGFDVYDDGTVTAETKRRQLEAAGKDRGDVVAASLQLGYEAAQCHVEMVSALQNADNAATAAKTAIDTAKTELGRLALLEAPSKQIRTMFPGLLHPETARPEELPPIVGEALKLEEGIPTTVTNPDGSTKTITPNPDGTVTVATSVQQPDGSTITTETTGNKPPVTTVTSTRTDGSGIVDMTVTGPDGKPQKFEKVAETGGKATTFAVNPDGSRGNKVSESYPQNGGIVTDRYGADGVIDRQWERPDGFRAFEQYVPGPDGNPTLVGTGNSAGMNSVLNQDGTITTTDSDGQTAITRQHPDGRIVTQFPDGSMMQYDPNAAPPHTPQPTVWDTTKAWTGTQWNSLLDSTADNVEQHPLAAGFSGATAAGGEFASRGSGLMAEQAQRAMADSQASQIRALQLLDSGAPGAGQAFVGAMDSATDANARAGVSQLLKSDGKVLSGWPLGAVVNSYVSWEDWHYHNKPLDEAAANAAGSTVGGSAGAWAGAGLGAAACWWATPIGQAFCAGAGAGLLGFGGGAFGGWAAEQPFK